MSARTLLNVRSDRYPHRLDREVMPEDVHFLGRYDNTDVYLELMRRGDGVVSRVDVCYVWADSHIHSHWDRGAPVWLREHLSSTYKHLYKAADAVVAWLEEKNIRLGHTIPADVILNEIVPEGR